MIIADALKWGKKELADAEVAQPMMEASWILSRELMTQSPIKPANLFLMMDRFIPKPHLKNYEKQIKRRTCGEPLSYILKSQEFMRLELFVNSDVLIPRPETEILVQEVLKIYPANSSITILDVGTGSGNIVISLARKLLKAKCFAADISNSVLKIARMNAEKYEVGDRIHFFRSNLFSSFSGEYALPKKFDLIVSNPPYIRSDKINSLQKEIQFEPRKALDGGQDGLKIIKSLIKKTTRFLKRNGYLVLEMGYDQSEKVAQLMRKSGFQIVKIVKDESEIDRVIIGRTAGE